MKVLHVNNIDLYGRRFNGYDLIDELSPRGIQCRQAVLTKLSRRPEVLRLMNGAADENLHRALVQVETRHSMNNLLFPWGRKLAESAEFAEADVVHYHLLHNQVVSLFDLPMLFDRKPSVWTFHDPWPFTGHCIYPLDCPRWLTGCDECPHLDVMFPMERDCADRMWRVKRRLYQQLDVDIVVASEFMLDMARRSPLTAHFERMHLIPFGIDTGAYLPDEERSASRRQLGIPEDDFVLFFRATNSAFKGLQYILEALGERVPDRRTTLIAVDQRHLLGKLERDYNVIELGWVENDSLYPRLYSACDAFLMPSTAEAFGLMALEAMAAGRPVVCFEGTSLPWVTHAPECGIAVPMGDSAALREAIDLLMADPGEARRRGELGRAIARERYDHSQYLDSLSDLYSTVAERSR